MADLEEMRLRDAVRALPGWGALFVEREHRVQARASCRRGLARPPAARRLLR